MPTQTASHPPANTSPRKLWFGTTAAAVTWIAQSTICELIASKACQNDLGNWGWISPLGVRWLMAAITLIALGVAAAGGLVSYRNWRAASEMPDLMRSEGRPRVQFMALVGIFASATFIVGIIWAGLPLIMLGICVKAR